MANTPSDEVLELEAPPRALCVFARGGQRHAVDVRSVVEVIELPPLVAVPLAPAQVRGVFAYRHEAVPVLDCVPGSEKPGFVVLVRHGSSTVGLAADSVAQASDSNGVGHSELPASFALAGLIGDISRQSAAGSASRARGASGGNGPDAGE